jgi:hypothetical protein
MPNIAHNTAKGVAPTHKLECHHYGNGEHAHSFARTLHAKSLILLLPACNPCLSPDPTHRVNRLPVPLPRPPATSSPPSLFRPPPVP